MRPSGSRTLRRFAFLVPVIVLPGCTADRLVGPGPAAAPEPQVRREITAVVGRHEGQEGRLQAIEMFRGDLAWLESRLRQERGDRRQIEAQIALTRDRIERLMAGAAAEVAADAIDEPVGEEAVRIVAAETEVAIWDAGESSTGRVYSHTQTDQYAKSSTKSDTRCRSMVGLSPGSCEKTRRFFCRSSSAPRSR